MKPALVVTVLLAVAISLVPRSEAKQYAADMAARAGEYVPSAPGQSVKPDQIEGNTQSSRNERPSGDTPAQWALVFIAAVTAIFICWQAVLTRNAISEMQKQTELQKSLKTQWVDLENWSAKAPWYLNDPVIVIDIFYDIVNHTEMPLTVKYVEIFTGSLKETSGSEYVLLPESRKSMSISVVIEDKEQINLFFSDKLVINLFGTITFKNAFGNLQRQLFGEVCKGGGGRGGDGTFIFERFDAWLPSEGDEGRPDTEQSQ